MPVERESFEKWYEITFPDPVPVWRADEAGVVKANARTAFEAGWAAKESTIGKWANGMTTDEINNKYGCEL